MPKRGSKADQCDPLPLTSGSSKSWMLAGCSLLAPLAKDLLSVPASEAFVESSGGYDEAWWPSGLSRLLSKPASVSVGSNPADGRP